MIVLISREDTHLSECQSLFSVRTLAVKAMTQELLRFFCVVKMKWIDLFYTFSQRDIYGTDGLSAFSQALGRTCAQICTDKSVYLIIFNQNCLENFLHESVFIQSYRF